LDPHLEPIEFKLGDMVCDAGGLLKAAANPRGMQGYAAGR